MGDDMGGGQIVQAGGQTNSLTLFSTPHSLGGSGMGGIGRGRG